jgi:hypothetical protein
MRSSGQQPHAIGGFSKFWVGAGLKCITLSARIASSHRRRCSNVCNPDKTKCFCALVCQVGVHLYLWRNNQRTSSAWQFHLVLTQVRKHHMQRLSQSEVETPVHRTLRLCLPEPPPPPAVCALTLCVDAVLPQQHDHACEHPHHLVVGYRLRGRFLTRELVRQCLKLFQKEPVACFPNVTHGSPWLHGRRRKD